MSALSTPGGGGNTAQSKPTSGKQKYQKLDINSLYCANRNENLEPSSVKSQLSRKHGMQSLGKVPSTRRPPANLPSLKTETGQDPNANPIPVVAPSVSSPPTCINPPTQPTPVVPSSIVAAGAGPGGWVSLPPPSSPHFRTEFPSLEAAAQPAHRTDQPTQPQLRPQTEGSWTSGGAPGGARQELNASPAAAPAPPAASQQTPAYRAILPPFLVKGSTGVGLGLGGLGALREARSGPATPPAARPPPRAAPAPRAVEVLTARPILRDEQISSLDDMSRDAGWAQHDDIDYDQKLDFSDGETSTRKNNNRASIDNERAEHKVSREAPEPGDEEQLWAERRQKQSHEVAQAVARARQRKEEEQRRRENRDPPPRDRNDNRDREPEHRERDRLETRDSRDRIDVRERERDRPDNRDKERNDRDVREKERVDNRDRDRNDRERFDNRDRDNRDNRDRERDRDKEPRDRQPRNDNRDRPESDKDMRQDIRDRDRGDNRDRADRERFDRERDRGDRERDRSDRDRDRSERDRDFRDRDRDHARDRDQNNPAFSKSFQANIPPRFLKQQQNRQQDDQQHKGWAFPGKPAPRRQEPQPQGYNAPRNTPHNNGRRSYSRDFSDREDDFRRDKDGSGPQWRSEMQDYEKSGRELDRSNSKESYKDFNEYKGKNDLDRKSSLEHAIEQSNRSAADKLSEVFERKSIGVAEPFATSESSAPSQTPEKHYSPPDNVSQRESSEKEIGKTSWAEVAQEETSTVLKPTEKVSPPRESEGKSKDLIAPNFNSRRNSQHHIAATTPPQNIPSNNSTYANAFQNQNKFNSNQTQSSHAMGGSSQQATQITCLPIVQQQMSLPVTQKQMSAFDHQSVIKPVTQPPSNIADSFAASQMQKQQQQLSEQLAKLKYSQQSEKVASESGLVTSKPSTDSLSVTMTTVEIAVETIKNTPDITKRLVDDKKLEVHVIHEQSHTKIAPKEPIERKSSGSGSEKKGRGFGSGGTGFAVYNNRGWGSRESRGRRSHRSSRSNNRASESDGSTDGAANAERKERRRAPRSPRGPKKPDRPEDANRAAPTEQALLVTDGLENREPFAPRGQPSRRGRGGFQGTTRPPAPAKRVTGYGPPNTKSPFNQTNRAAKENEGVKDNSQMEDKSKGRPRPGSQATGRGRDRKPKGPGVVSGEDENWETTSEHSEGGGGRRRSVPGRLSQKGPGGRNQNNRNQNNPRNNNQGVKKDNLGDNKTADVTEAMTDLKTSTAKKDDDVADDGFQEVRNKKNSKDTRGPPVKEENQQSSKQQPRSHSNQGNGRNGSSSRIPSDKSNPRGAAPVVNKNGQYDPRPRQANLAPRFVKQRQKQQLGMVSGYGPDTGAAPPPPAVNAWDKPIAQTLRGNIDEPSDLIVNKSAQSSQRSTPLETPIEIKPLATSCVVPADKSEVLDGTTPPVETIIFENTNYKSAPSEEALQQKYQMTSNIAKPPQPEEIPPEMEAHPLAFNGADVRRPRSIQELIGDNGRPVSDGEALALQMSFDTTQKAEDSSDIKLDFAFDSDLGQLTEDKSAKSLGLPRGVHMSTSNTISPLAADLNLKIASVKKVWEMPAVAEGTEELQFAGFEEANTETGAPPNVCKVKPTQQLQSPPPQHYNHVGYQGGYGGLSVPSPPAMLFNSSQQLLGSSQQLPQQGGLYGAFLDQSRGQFGGFPGTPYGAGSAAPYNYQPPPDMFQSLPNQYRMAATAGGGGFGQSGQLGNNPSTVLISSTSNSLMSATVKSSSQQIGAIGSKGGGVGGVGGVSAYQQQYLGYSTPVGEAPYGLLPRPAPPQNSYYSAYQPPAAPAPTYPLQFTQQPQSGAFGSQFLSSQLQVAAAVQQMQQQYRAPMQQQYAPAPPRQVPQQLKSPLHEHANGFAPLCDSASPTPKQQQQNKKPPHSPPQHKYHAPPPHPPPALTPHQHHQQQMASAGSNGRCGGGGAAARGGMVAPRYPAPIQRPHAPHAPLYRHAPPAQPPRAHHAPARHTLYYQHHQRS